MGALQIVILLVGAVLFTISFFIPERQTSVKEIREKEEKAVRDIIDQEMRGIQDKIDDATSDTIEHAKETAERAMDRLTNEKIMAVNEYSDTVLDEIHKNHEEAVFLYDMLNNKHAQVKTTLAELNQAVTAQRETAAARRDLSAARKSVSSAKEALADGQKEADVFSEKKETVKKESEPKKAGNIKTVSVSKDETAGRTTKNTDNQPGAENTSDREIKVINAFGTKSEDGVEVMLGSSEDDQNNNDRILALHKEGKSNMAIARELGLGIGEVKLVIDLFEGGM